MSTFLDRVVGSLPVFKEVHDAVNKQKEATKRIVLGTENADDTVRRFLDAAVLRIQTDRELKDGHGD